MNNKETMSWIISSDTKVYVVNQTKQTESTGHCRKKRGFTLVELIVVLTILAILASILIPALTGYIDKANGTRIVSKARNLLTASQTVVSSHYAKESAFDRTTTYFRENGLSNAIIELSEAEGEFECSIRSICPGSKSHMLFLVIGTFYNQFSSRMTVNRKVHFILYCCIKPFRCCRSFVIIYRSGINICDFPQSAWPKRSFLYPETLLFPNKS